MSPKFSGMLSYVGNLLFIIRLHNLMGKYRTSCFRVDRITGDLYIMEATSMALISERKTFMPQVTTSVGVIFQYPSQVLSSPLMADNKLTLPAAESTQMPQADRVITGNEEKGAIGGTPLSITSHSSSMNIGLGSINLTQEMLNEESGEKTTG